MDDTTDLAATATARIVVGVDGSGASHRALAWAADEARLRHASLEVVHAWHFPYSGGIYSAPASFDPRLIEEGAQATLDQAIEATDTTGLGTVTRTLSTDGPAEAVLTAAKGATLVVVGSRGRGGFTGLLLGSVSQQVVHHATCPVAVIPTAD